MLGLVFFTLLILSQQSAESIIITDQQKTTTTTTTTTDLPEMSEEEESANVCGLYENVPSWAWHKIERLEQIEFYRKNPNRPKAEGSSSWSEIVAAEDVKASLMVIQDVPLWSEAKATLTAQLIPFICRHQFEGYQDVVAFASFLGSPYGKGRMESLLANCYNNRDDKDQKEKIKRIEEKVADLSNVLQQSTPVEIVATADIMTGLFYIQSLKLPSEAKAMLTAQLIPFICGHQPEGYKEALDAATVLGASYGKGRIESLLANCNNGKGDSREERLKKDLDELRKMLRLLIAENEVV